MNFSIVICTHNPSPLIFGRLLTAMNKIKAQQDNPNFQVLIVDNNSTPALSEVNYVKEFLMVNEEAVIIQEKKSGLTAARIAGVKAAIFEWIIFFDDDNEPSSDYLIETNKLIQEYPQVGVWGPGKIAVEFIGDASQFAHNHKELFQERDMQQTVIDNVRWDQDAYPYGTGMIVKREVMNSYIENVESDRYTMSDRVGKSLISGGDIQILLTGIKLGFYAGSSPFLRLNHLIKAEKTYYLNMLQLAFMLSASAVKTYNQVFTDAPFPVSSISNKEVARTFYSQLRFNFLHSPLKETIFNLSKKMGELQAQVIAAPSNVSTPFLLRGFKKFIKA